MSEDERENGQPPDQLPLAAPIYAAKYAKEILRIWETDDRLLVLHETGVWDDPFLWGMALADAVQHIARGYVEDGGLTREGPNGETVPVTLEQAIERIREGFDAELNSPTDEPKKWTPDA